MYILIVYFVGATSWATTFDSSFQEFQTEIGCNTAKNLIVDGTKPLVEGGMLSIVECVHDSVYTNEKTPK